MTSRLVGAVLLLLALALAATAVGVLLLSRRGGIAVPLPSGATGAIIRVLLFPVVAAPTATLVVSVLLGFAAWKVAGAPTVPGP